MNTVAKRILFGLLALVLTLSLVACGGDNGTTATTTAGDEVVTTTVVDPSGENTTTTTVGSEDKPSSVTSSTKSTTSTKAPTANSKGKTWAEVKAGMPANLKNTSITFFNWNEAKSITDAEKVIANFTKETGITVKWELGTNSTVYVTEVAARVAAQNAPDIVRMKDVNPALLSQLQPLSSTGYDFSDAAWDSGVLDMYSYKGTPYAANLKDTLMQQPDVLMYNKGLINKYDLEDPYALWKSGKWTWDKFVELCTDFKDQAGDSATAYSPFRYQWCAQMMGADFVKYDPDTGYRNTMSDKKLIDGFQMVIKFKEAGLATENPWQRQSFEAGNVLFFHDAIIGARKTHFYFVDFKTNGSLGVVPLPKIEGVTNYQLFAELEAYAISKGAKNPKAAPYFMRYFLDAKNYNANTFFANKNILDVYNSCMAQKNRFMTYNDMTVLTDETGLKHLEMKIANSTAAQVATLLSQKKPVVESAVRQANSTLSKM